MRLEGNRLISTDMTEHLNVYWGIRAIQRIQVQCDAAAVISLGGWPEQDDVVEGTFRIVRLHVDAELRRSSFCVLERTVGDYHLLAGGNAQSLASVVRCQAMRQDNIVRRSFARRVPM